MASDTITSLIDFLDNQDYGSDPVEAVRKLLAQGLSPNETRRDPMDFACALGVASRLGFDESVQALLNAGAKPVWPTGETVIAFNELLGLFPNSGEGEDPLDRVYTGFALDPLFLACNELAWKLEIGSRDYSGDRKAAAPLLSTIKHLLAAGAPVYREDPALHIAPLDNFLVTVMENWVQPYSRAQNETIADVLWHSIESLPNSEEMARCVVDQDWGELNFSNLEWYVGMEDEDALTLLTNYAEQKLLQLQTHGVSVRKNSPRL